MNKLEFKRKINSLYILKRIKRIGGANFLDKDKKIDIEDYLCFGQWNDIVKEFDNKFRNNFSESQYNNFKKNIRNVIIRKKRLSNKKLNEDGTRGLYDPKDNSIYVYANSNEERFFIKERLTHELMHMASRKDAHDCGFHYYRKEKGAVINLGKSLNEGMTEYLNAAYISYGYNEPYYNVEKVFASGIEKIVGKDLMRDAYFEGDLLKVVGALSEYTTPKEALNLIFDMDKLSNLYCSCSYDKEYKKIVKKISKIMETKINKQLKNGIIDIGEFEKSKFLDVDMYKKYGFIYTDRKGVVIQEYNDYYKVISEFQNVCLSKDKNTLKFDSDVKILR